LFSDVTLAGKLLHDLVEYRILISVFCCLLLLLVVISFSLQYNTEDFECRFISLIEKPV